MLGTECSTEQDQEGMSSTVACITESRRYLALMGTVARQMVLSALTARVIQLRGIGHRLGFLLSEEDDEFDKYFLSKNFKVRVKLLPQITRPGETLKL